MLTKKDFNIWYDVQGCGEVTLAINPLKSEKQAKKIRRQILKNEEIMKLLKKLDLQFIIDDIYHMHQQVEHPHRTKQWRGLEELKRIKESKK